MSLTQSNFGNKISVNTVLSDRVKLIEELKLTSPDIVTRIIETPTFCGALFHIEGLVEVRQLEEAVVIPINSKKDHFCDDYFGIKSVIGIAGTLKEIEIGKAGKSLSEGSAVLVTKSTVVEISARKVSARAISEPPTSSVIKGPREGFVEDVRTNVVILRKRLKSENFAIKELIMGKITATKINIVYLKGIADESIVESVSKRIEAYSIDGIIDSSYVAKMIESNPYSMFKQVGNSEKPDVIASKLLDGKVAIIVDGSPIVLVVPFMLYEDFEDSQDKYKRPLRTTFLRYVRLLAVFCAVFLPALFVSVQLYQFQLLPLELLITVINVTDQIPFSPSLEMVIALVLFEVLGEASIRMPRHVGMALGVVGAIVLGETAVSAGFLSSLTVLVVAISGIGIYAVPDEVGTLGLLRILFVVVADLLGIFGLTLAGLMVIAYLTGIGSYGIPYLVPVSPLIGSDFKDSIFKRSLTDLFYRPESFAQKNKRRMQKLK